MDTKDRTVNNASPFEQIFKEHVGKVSDKWQLYLNEYESVFEEWRNKPVRLLEIGTQNGGSLEIFSKYFANAQSLTGCDIEPKCAELRYVDPRISVIIGDVNSDECEEQIANVCPCFDIIVDDGSHNSRDIIRSFSRYFKRLGNNGIYVVEDMHASYWAKWGGGLHVPYSAMAFFKRLADVISHEHWRLDKSRAQHLKEFAERFCVRFDEGTLSSVHSITFANSLCFIRKCPPAANKVGPRVVAGKHEPVLSGVRDKGGTSISNIVAENPDDEHLDVFRLVQAVEERAREVSRLESALTDRQQTIHAMLGQIETLTARMKDVERRADTQAEQGHRLNKELWDAQTRNSELAAVADERAQAIGKLEAELERWRESCSELRAKAAALEERAGHWERTAQRDQSRLEAVERELASYQEQVQSLKGHTAERDQRLRDLERKLASAGTRARNMEDVAKQWAKRLAEQETELAGQRDAARQAEQDFAGEREKLANLERKTRSSRWLFRQVATRLVHAPSDVTRRASQRRKDKRRYQRNYRLIAESELFDRNWYLENNPDVAAAGIDPVRHYLLHGGFEGRAPSPDFDSAWYLAQNRDVAAAGVNPLSHYLRFGRAERRNPLFATIERCDLFDFGDDKEAELGQELIADHVTSTRADAHTVSHTTARPALGNTIASVDRDYLVLRQEILFSGLWDEAFYISRHYENYINYKNKNSITGEFFPLDYYLQEGWRFDHQPSDLLPIDVDQRKIGCSKIEYFLTRLRFKGYQFDKNIWVPTTERIWKYLDQKQRRSSQNVVYTCIVQNYDVLMQPYFIADDWDYVCFTDDAALLNKWTVGVWEIRPLAHRLSSPSITNRWHKIHPHIILQNHQKSIYIDGNINILSQYIFEQVAHRDTSILFPRHFIRNCIYQEIEVLQRRPVTTAHDKVLLQSLRRYLEKESFPREFGLSENNVIYRRHHDTSIVKLMRHWWSMLERYISRDQASLAYVFWKNGISLNAHMFVNCRVNYLHFWVMKHKRDLPGAELTKQTPVASAPETPLLAPAFGLKNIAVVFSTNEYFIKYLGVAIFSLIENAVENYNYDIIILAKGLSDSFFTKIRSLANGHSNVSIRVYDTTTLLETLPKDIFYVDGYVPVETYNKCFLAEILSPEYDRCVYLDSDILILHDIQELHDIDLQGCSIGASVNVANINAAFCQKIIKGRKFDDYLTNDLGVLDNNKYFQAGVLVLDMKKLHKMNLRTQTIDTLKRVKRPIFFDQCIFNSIFYRDVCFFSTAWNHVWYMQQYSYLRGSVSDDIFFDYARGRVAPKIVHYAGKDKPQNTVGWTLSDLFWKYAYASPFFDDIYEDVTSKDNEISRMIESDSNNEWYKVRPRLLVHLHLFYRNQLNVMLEALRNISQCDCELFVTMVERDENVERQIRSEWGNAHIIVLPNVGYDVYPFLHVLRQVRLSTYDFILKIHTKNVRRLGQDDVYGIKVPGYQWRDELLGALVGSKDVFKRNLTSFLEDKKLGCIGAGKFIFCTEENREEQTYRLTEWRKKCGVERGIHYVGGSMFFARAYPFERLAGLNMQPKDFTSPRLTTKDHKNTAHVFERLFGIVVENEGFEIRGAIASEIEFKDTIDQCTSYEHTFRER